MIILHLNQGKPWLHTRGPSTTGTFHYRKGSLYMLAINAFSLSSLSALGNLSPDVSVDLPILEILYKWNHATCSVCACVRASMCACVHVASFTLRDTLKAHLCCSLSISLCGWTKFHCVDLRLFSVCSAADGHLGCFYEFWIKFSFLLDL